MATVKAQICNLAASRCGHKGSVEDIDDPNKPVEKICAKWWLTSLKMALAEMKPSFATTRRTLSVNSEAPLFGYSSQYSYPSDCLSLLGIGNIQDKCNDYTIEEGFIRTDAADGEELEVRMVILEADVSKFTPDFVEEMSIYLAVNINMELTQDVQKQVYLNSILKERRPQCAAINSQENRPVRINRSKFKESRNSGFPASNYKK